MAKTTTSLTFKLATPFIAGLILIALYGAFLFDPDGSAIGLLYLGHAPESLFATLWGMIGDTVWVMGAFCVFLGFVSILNLLDDLKAEQTAIVRYLTTRDDQTSVDELYPNRAWALPFFCLNCTAAVIGIASGFWFTATAWLVSMITTRGQHQKLRKITFGLDSIALEQGLDGVRKLATPETMKLVLLSEMNEAQTEK